MTRDELLVWLLPLCTAAAHPDVTLLWLVYLVETDSSVVQTTAQDLKDCGFDCWETSIGGPGVQQHSPLSVKEEVLEILNGYWETTRDSGWSRGWTRLFVSFVVSVLCWWTVSNRERKHYNEWSWTGVLITDFTDWLLWKLTREMLNEWQRRGIHIFCQSYSRCNYMYWAVCPLGGIRVSWIFLFINRIHSKRLW